MTMKISPFLLFPMYSYLIHASSTTYTTTLSKVCAATATILSSSSSSLPSSRAGRYNLLSKRWSSFSSSSSSSCLKSTQPPSALLAFSSSASPLSTLNFSPTNRCVIRGRSQNIASLTRKMVSTSLPEREQTRDLVVDPFCFRQFSESEASKSYSGTVFNISISEFEKVVNSRYEPQNLQPGYAPFCKHIFIANDFTDARVNVLRITADNEHCLRSKYDARNEKELPVLTRYFDEDLLKQHMLANGERDGALPVAKYLDLILYSREQIEKENAAMGNSDSEGKETSPWGIVSIKAQDIDKELPMTPITAMRNALGKDQGGSGVPLDRDAYMTAYEYWKDHATVA